jgi:mannose-6-phosphate isomerase-like protein (cupin superfamily)
VLSGMLTAQVGDEIVEAGPRAVVTKPRGIPHAFWNAGEETVRFVEVITPRKVAGVDRAGELEEVVLESAR